MSMIDPSKDYHKRFDDAFQDLYEVFIAGKHRNPEELGKNLEELHMAACILLEKAWNDIKMDSFIKSIRFSSVYNILKTKGKTQNVIESRCGFYIETENNEKIKLFRCAISLLDILTRTKDHDLAKIVSKFGVHKGGIYTCDYSTIKEFIDIQDVEFVNALSEAACLTFKEKYNSCLKNIVYLKNRNKVGSFSILK